MSVNAQDVTDELHRILSRSGIEWQYDGTILRRGDTVRMRNGTVLTADHESALCGFEDRETDAGYVAHWLSWHMILNGLRAGKTWESVACVCVKHDGRNLEGHPANVFTVIYGIKYTQQMKLQRPQR
jgi:hypothetical protein